MNTKKVFLTTISELKDRRSVDYFVCSEEEYGIYTTAMSITEAGIKYIVSKYDIDEIIVLGGKNFAKKLYKKLLQNGKKCCKIRENKDFLLKNS